MVLVKTLWLSVILLLGVCSQGALIEIMASINGYSIPAAVDTGSEITVMSASCAKRCQILNQVDTKLSGKVKGIGSTGEVIGAIRRQKLRLGSLNFVNRVDVLRDSHRDLIIGLDVLQRFNGVVHLGEKTLQLDVQGRPVVIPILSYGKSPSPPLTVQELSGGFRDESDESEEESDEYGNDNEERVSMEGV